MSTVVTTPLFGLPPVPIRRFTVKEYHRMMDAGILTEDDAVELLEGWIVAKMPHNPPHGGTVQCASKRLGRRLPAGWDLRVQSAVTTGDSEPEPDLAVVRGDEAAYLHRHPGPADIGLLIEVSDSTLSQDRQVKGRLYARAAVPQYWIVNLVDRWIEAYSDPDPSAASPQYRARTDYRPGDMIPLILDGQVVVSLAVADLLP